MIHTLGGNEYIHELEDSIDDLEAKVSEQAKVICYKETLQTQLDRVDEALAWEGTGLGRVGTVRAMHNRIKELEALVQENYG